MLIADPTLSKTNGSSYECYPLLVAVMHDPPLTLVQSLIAANPDALTIKNKYGMLPLRTAIRSKASTDVIDAIIRAAPSVVKSFGVSGKVNAFHVYFAFFVILLLHGVCLQSFTFTPFDIPILVHHVDLSSPCLPLLHGL